MQFEPIRRTIALVAGEFLIVAAAACVPPLRRALAVDPSVALRSG